LATGTFNAARHFDTKAIYAVSARPMLMLSGDQDGRAPADGIEVLEKKLAAVYRLHGKADQFRSIVYKNTGHEYLPEMKDEMAQWFERYLRFAMTCRRSLRHRL
jgi:hypothetical protein